MSGVIIWSAYEQHGGFRRLLIDSLGFFAFKQFAESVAPDTGSVEVRFGYHLLGRRLYYFTVPLEKIQEVEWSPGQNPELWIVFVWYDHDNPERSLKRRMLRKPDQDIYCVGPSQCRERTETLGLAFVDFLLRGGARLVREDDCTFVRATDAPQIGDQVRPSAEEDG